MPARANFKGESSKFIASVRLGETTRHERERERWVCCGTTISIAVTACVFVVPPSTTIGGIGGVLERVGTISGGDHERDFSSKLTFIHTYIFID